MFQPLFNSLLKVAALGELAVSCIVFFWEQVKEFVDVAAPRDLMGSCKWKSFIAVKAGIRRSCSNLETNLSRACDYS